MTKNEHLLIAKIAKRAEAHGALLFDRLSLIMDIEAAHKQFNLRLDDLLAADDVNFLHDIVGIQRNINRETKVIENHFLPRYVRG